MEVASFHQAGLAAQGAGMAEVEQKLVYESPAILVEFDLTVIAGSGGVGQSGYSEDELLFDQLFNDQ